MIKINGQYFTEIEEFHQLSNLLGQTLLWHGTRYKNFGWVTILDRVYIGVISRLYRPNVVRHINGGKISLPSSELYGYAMREAKGYTYNKGIWVLTGDFVSAITEDDFYARRPQTPNS